MSFVGALRSLHRKLGRPARFLSPLREAVEPSLRMWKFERDRKARLRKHDGSQWGFQERTEIVAQLKRDGFAVIPQAIEPGLLLGIRRQVESHLDAGTSLLPISRDSARTRGDLGAAQSHLSPNETRLGQNYFRQHTNYVSIASPLTACPATVQAAFHPLLIDIAWSYLGCVPAIGGMNLRKSYGNDLPEFDTLYFHVDPNSPKFLKFFFYLQDVDMTGGPFCYVRGSHRRRFAGWKRKGRWTLEEMEAAYGRENVRPLTAKLGDLVVADTNGFHRGTKVVANDRTMLTVNYVIHEELDGTQDKSQFPLPRAVYERLSARERAVADLLEIR